MRKVSIIIATFNRAQLLYEALESLAPAIAHYGGPVEVIVVNNCCADATDERVTAFQRLYPQLSVHLIHEDRIGLSYARNTGMRHAQGDVICFVDDDVLAPEAWLSELLQAFTLAEHVGCIAGRIKLRWPDIQKPDWVDEKYHGFYSQYEHGATSLMLPRGDIFYGANFALTREAVEQVGEFNTALGRKGASLLSGEDAEYAGRLWQAGFSIAYSATGFLYHRVSPERLTVSWLWRRYLMQGVTSYFAPEHHFPAYPLYGLPKLLKQPARAAVRGIDFE